MNKTQEISCILEHFGLLSVCFILCTESPMWGYRFVNKNLTWSEAQQFCRQHYHDLACVSSSEDNLRLPRPPGYSAPVWIGLYDDPTDMSQWKWTATNSSVSYVNWWFDPTLDIDEPEYIHEDQQCGALNSVGWVTSSSSSRRKALCYSGSNPKVFHSSNTELTWNDALTYCRTNYKDLAMIESSEENSAAVAAKDSALAWIGLIRPGGQWSDNRPLTYSNWYLWRKKKYQEPFCVTQNAHNSWDVSSCQEKRPFFCQEEPKSHRFVKIKFSGHDLGASVINQDILEEIQKRFEAEGRADVKIKWKTAPEKQVKKNEEDKPEDCPDV